MDSRRSEYEQIQDHINSQVVEITAHYAGGQIRREGERVIFRCPSCHKDKLTAHPAYMRGPVTGCWTHDCSMPQAMSPVNFIAYIEGLDTSDQYRMVLDEGNKIIAGPLLAARDRIGSEKNEKNKKNFRLVNQRQEGQEEDLKLTDAVYRRLITSCGLTPEAWEGLKDRGLTKQTVLDAGIGYISASKAQVIMKSLHDEFGDDLARVPGFYPVEKSATIRYWSNFAGKNLILFPYHDSNGLIRTVEGRVMFGEEHKYNYKYLSLTGSGSHLYVYPGMGFGNIEAFCEGLFGAILAAQDGICVASIQGFRRFRASGGRHPLPELLGIDFAGRTIPYIPDMDDPPNPEVANEAPEAARWLIERQGGRPIISVLPSGKDLDEHFLEFQSQQRRPAFQELIAERSCTLQRYTELLEKAQARKDSTPAYPEQESEQHLKQPDDSSGRQSEEPRDHRDSSNHHSVPEDTGHNEQILNPDQASPDHASRGGPDTEDTEKYEDSRSDDGGPQEDDENQEDGTEPQDTTTSESLNDHVTMSKVPGEQFYRHDISLPEQLTEPKLALGSKGEESPESDETEEKEPWYKRVGSYLGQGTIKLANRATRTTLKLSLTFAALYLSLVIVLGLLTQGGAFEGMWKWIALSVIFCAILRSRLGHKTRRFIEGRYSPGAKGG